MGFVCWDQDGRFNQENVMIFSGELDGNFHGGRGGSRIDLRGGLSIPRALARAKFYVLRPLLTSFPHTTSYTKKKLTNKIVAIII